MTHWTQFRVLWQQGSYLITPKRRDVYCQNTRNIPESANHQLSFMPLKDQPFGFQKNHVTKFMPLVVHACLNCRCKLECCSSYYCLWTCNQANRWARTLSWVCNSFCKVKCSGWKHIPMGQPSCITLDYWQTRFYCRQHCRDRDTAVCLTLSETSSSRAGRISHEEELLWPGSFTHRPHWGRIPI